MQRSFLGLLLCPVMFAAARAQSTLPDDPSESFIVCAVPCLQVASVREITDGDIPLDTTMTTGGINGASLRTQCGSFEKFNPAMSRRPDDDRADQDMDDLEIVACEGILILPSSFTGEYGDDFRGAVNAGSDHRRQITINEDTAGTGPTTSSSGAPGPGPDIR